MKIGEAALVNQEGCPGRKPLQAPRLTSGIGSEPV